MAEADAPLVLVTGASGYIATHIIKQLQTQGKCRVRGTVRNLKNEDKVKELKGLVPDATHPLELVEAELNDEECWKAAVQGCTFVYHVASPFPMANPRDENELIVPAVNGTVNVLKACVDAGTVKRVVVTSSCAAVTLNDDSHVLTEKDWAQEENASAYYKSKIRAERAAWEFVEKLEDGKKFELAVVNPSAVFGPFLTRSSSGSIDIIKGFLNKDIPALADITFGVVDVRDVAAAHIAAMEKPEAAGNRHIVSEREMSMKEISDVISREFTPQGYSIPSMTIPKFLAWPMKFFNQEMKLMYPMIGKKIHFNNDRFHNVLGIQAKDPAVSIIETCYCLIEGGIVPKKPGYLGPPESRKPKDPPLEEVTTTKESSDQPEKAATEGATESSDQPEKPVTEETTESSDQPEKPATEETTESSDQPEKPATKETTESGDQPEKPATEETTESSDQPEKPATEETTESSDQPEKPATEETTESSDQPEKPATEETTESSDQPEKPATEETTESSDQPEKPATEETTESSDQPEKPATEETTESSDQPEKPATEETTESSDQPEKPATEETTESSDQPAAEDAEQ